MKAKQKVDELVMANTGLKQLLKLKNRELKNIRKLAQTILDQRTEVEQYFLEALEQVKSEIRQKREDEYRLQMAEYNAQMRKATASKGSVKFPSIKAPSHASGSQATSVLSGIMGAGLSREAPQMSMNDKVDLRDLSWEDRESIEVIICEDQQCSRSDGTIGRTNQRARNIERDGHGNARRLE